MISISNFSSQNSAKKNASRFINLKSPSTIGGHNKAILIFCLCFFATINVYSQKGFFAKFSIGPGFTKEYSSLNKSGISIITKNHAIGFGITEKLAIQVGEFGGLNKINFGNYNYINLDVFGLGFTYITPIDLKISLIGGYSIVSYAKKWSESFGDKAGNGYGFNISIDKEWFIKERWAVRAGPQLFWLTTTDTDSSYFNVSFNASLLFYLKPIQETSRKNDY